MITKDPKEKKTVAKVRGVDGGRIAQGVAGVKTQNSPSTASKVGGLAAKRINIGPRSSMDQAQNSSSSASKAGDLAAKRMASKMDKATQEAYSANQQFRNNIHKPGDVYVDPAYGNAVKAIGKGIAGAFPTGGDPATIAAAQAQMESGGISSNTNNTPLSITQAPALTKSAPNSVAAASPAWPGFTPSQPKTAGTNVATMASQNMIANEITKAQQRQGIAGAQAGGSGGLISSTSPNVPPSTTPGTSGISNEGEAPKSPTAIVQQYSTLQQNGVAPDPTILNPLLQYVGLDQPVSYAEGGQVRQEPLQIGQIVRDMNGGALRGIRADVVVALGTQYTGSPEAVAEALSKIGTNALTVDEVRIMNLMKKPTNHLNAFGESGGNDMGFEWANDTMAVASDGSIGRVDSMGYPIFSGFYRGNDGAYHPLGSVASYSRNNYGSGGGGRGGPSGPTPPVVIGNTTPNGQAGDLGNLVQPVF